MALDSVREKARQQTITKSQTRRTTQATRTENLPVKVGGAAWLPAVVRAIDSEAGTVSFQLFGYSDSPPVFGNYQTFGNVIIGFPFPSFTAQNFAGNVMASGAEISIFTRPVVAKKNRQGDWIVWDRARKVIEQRFGFYVFGGDNPFGEGLGGETAQSSRYSFDLWVIKESLRHPVRTHHAGAEADQTMYAIGGAIAELRNSVIHWLALRDTNSNKFGDSWTKVMDLNVVARHSHSAMTISDIILATGGVTSDQFLRTVGKYLPATDTWEAFESLLVRVGDHVSFAIQEDGYVVGGEQLELSFARDCLKTQLDGSWMFSTPAPVALRNHSSFVIADLAYIVGGETLGGPIDRVDQFNPTTETWSAQTPISPARSAHSGGNISSSGLVQAGLGSAGLLSDNQEFVASPQGGVWTARAGLPTCPTNNAANATLQAA